MNDQEQINDLQSKLNEAEGRVIELECALKWWLNERMKGYSEDQYGKRQMRRILDIRKESPHNENRTGGERAAFDDANERQQAIVSNANEG